MSVAVIVPVLNRPHRAAPLVESVKASEGAVPLRLVFVVSASDIDELAALEPLDGAADVLVVPPWSSGDYARKINAGYRNTTEPWIFTGADDLNFWPGWADHAVACGGECDAGVVGTNDLGNPTVMRGEHATHSLVRRTYADAGAVADQAGQVFHEGYGHQYCDTELVETAKAAGRWAFCADSIVEHLHPFWSKGTMDETYERGLATSSPDHALFMERRRLWR